MDDYDNYAACHEITAFVDALSNWYVRRSRDRFWSADKRAPDKLDAYWTLYECLLTTSKLVAPFVPFLAESLWQNLAAEPFGKRTLPSVHLCDFPTGDLPSIDPLLSQRMGLVREIASQGRSARMGASLKVRQPLAKVEVVLASNEHRAWLAEHAALIAEELNVKRVEFADQADEYVTYTVVPDFRRLGPRLGKQLPAVKKALAECDAAKLLGELRSAGFVTLDVPGGPVMLDNADVQVRLQAKPGWAAAQGQQCVVVLATELTEALILEGIANDLVRAVQDRRKEIGCEYTDRISVGLVTSAAELRTAVGQFREAIRGETLAIALTLEPLAGAEGVAVEVAGHPATLYVKKP
jgi:isoleucyl-tRNA synthetase